MMAFGQHLGAYKNAGFTTVYRIKHCLHCTFASGAITVNSNNFGVGEALLQKGLAALCTLANRDQLVTLAAWTLLRNTLLVVTMMADQTMASAVYRKPGVALVAFCAPATLLAKHCRSKTPSVEEYQSLLLVAECRAYSRHG
jgi:hypothetical protein